MLTMFDQEELYHIYNALVMRRSIMIKSFESGKNSTAANEALGKQIEEVEMLRNKVVNLYSELSSKLR